MCGEKFTCFAHRSTLPGSPPRVRGKVLAAGLNDLVDGITPACAGKSLLPPSAPFPVRDHPRVCGEKSYSLAVLGAASGSPPRVRGKVMSLPQVACTSRITPACAGKSCRASAKRFPSGDHPRVCGEKENDPMKSPWTEGSPPRVRGKADPKKHRTRQAGITPACAGKRLGNKPIIITSGDHPRVCGEKNGRRYRSEKTQGSPPRVRGKGLLSKKSLLRGGITPACAGKSCSGKT